MKVYFPGVKLIFFLRYAKIDSRRSLVKRGNFCPSGTLIRT
jgi:hypothetical protein